MTQTGADQAYAALKELAELADLAGAWTAIAVPTTRSPGTDLVTGSW